MALVNLSDDNFQNEVLKSELPVLVDFWAPWCGPCKMVAPVLEECAKEFDGKIKICKVNVDDNSKTATHYGIMSIPTLMFFKKGVVIEQVVGALNKQQLKKKIQDCF